MQLMREVGFAMEMPSASQRPFEITFSRSESRANLYQLDASR